MKKFRVEVIGEDGSKHWRIYHAKDIDDLMEVLHNRRSLRAIGEFDTVGNVVDLGNLN